MNRKQDVELFVPEAWDLPELGRICFEAFRQISESHGFTHDFPNAQVATNALSLIHGLPSKFQIAARVGARLAGSNFMILVDHVAGVGPITVAPEFQGMGIGRKLMKAALEYAAQNGFEQVRLMQDSYNTASLSLYASLGFAVREPIGSMTSPVAGAPDPAVRRVQPADLPALNELCVRLYKISRRNELAGWLERDFVVLLHEARGRIDGYLMPGKVGHGVAETKAVALTLLSQLPLHVPPEQATFYCPLRNTDLYRGALSAGCRLSKVMNLMTLGPYEPPTSFWMPSIAY